MPGKCFFDTNVLVYSLAGSGTGAAGEDDPRGARAEELLASGGVLSVQILNEFTAVARRKLLMSWTEVAEAVDAFLVLCPDPLSITIETHSAARVIAEKHGYNIYDALVVAAALESGCSTLYSEDFQDGQVIEGRLTVRNPFGKASR
jgi:predicted nucleic acid-binding protein